MLSSLILPEALNWTLDFHLLKMTFFCRGALIEEKQLTDIRRILPKSINFDNYLILFIIAWWQKKTHGCNVSEMFWNEKNFGRAIFKLKHVRLFCGDNNSLQQSEYNLQIANLYRFSHLQPFRLLLGSLIRSWEPAGISRELGFFQVSSYLSCREIQIGKKRKEKKEKIKRRKRRKKEKKKRGKEEERKTKKDFLSFIFAKFHARWMNHPGRRVGSLKSGNHFACLFFSPPCHRHASISIQLLNTAQSPP